MNESIALVVEQLQISKKEESSMQRLREADLRDHLDNGNGKPDDKKTSEESGDDSEKKEDLRDDYQLNEALNLLKGVNIVRQAK